MSSKFQFLSLEFEFTARPELTQIGLIRASRKSTIFLFVVPVSKHMCFVNILEKDW